MSETRHQAECARRAFLQLSTQADHSRILTEIADGLLAYSEDIFQANQEDLSTAQHTLAPPMFKRLVLNEPKLQEVVADVRQLALMPDPLSVITHESELDEGLTLKKITTPIDVIAMIFE